MFLHLHSSLATFQDNHKENSHATLEYPAVPHTVTDLCHCQFFICSPQVLSHGVNDLLLLLSGCCELLGSLVQGGDFPAIAFHVILQHLVPSGEHSKAGLPHCTVQLTRGMHTAVCFMVLCFSLHICASFNCSFYSWSHLHYFLHILTQNWQYQRLAEQTISSSQRTCKAMILRSWITVWRQIPAVWISWHFVTSSPWPAPEAFHSVHSAACHSLPFLFYSSQKLPATATKNRHKSAYQV